LLDSLLQEINKFIDVAEILDRRGPFKGANTIKLPMLPL